MTNRQALLSGVAVLLLVAFAVQCVIDLSPVNVAASCIVLFSSLSVLLYIHWTRAIDTHPLSTFAILGFCFTTQMGALFFQSLDGEPITRFLRQPLGTFGWLVAYQWTAMASHAAYRLFSRPTVHAGTPTTAPRLSLLRTVLVRIGIYTAPPPATLWVMAGFGLLGIALGNLPNALGKVFHGLSFLAWAPFLIPIFIFEFGAAYAGRARQLLFVALYALLIAVVSMAVNARGMMLSGVMTISLVFLMSALRSQAPFKSKHVAYGIAVAVAMAVLSEPVSDLVTAMRVARKDRGRVDVVRMVENTLYAFERKDLLKAERNSGKFISVNSNYDEVYFNAELVDRLVETKFHDNALYFGNRLTEADQGRLWDVTTDFMWSILPQPALDALNIELSKESVGFSMGDYMSYLGATGAVGSYRTGSGVAHGLALFGPAFLPVMFMLFFAVFWGIDLFSYIAPSGRIAISALGMLGIWRLFQYGICTESITALLTQIVRGLPQSILLYAVVLGLSASIARAMGFARRNTPAPAMAMHGRAT